MNVSPSFSPPIRLMKPYFMLSVLFYVLSLCAALFIDPLTPFEDFTLIAWVHLYMLGFVMLAIFAAMAQLGPIVIESNHYNVKIFKHLHKALIMGLFFLLSGFLYNTTFLLFGGGIVLGVMLVYAGEFLLTLKYARRKTSITKAMKMSNFFLLIGIMTGLTMAAAFNNIVDLNPHEILEVHTFGLVVGFVILLIMGISIILIPMFATAKRVSDNEFSSSFITLSIAVFMMIGSSFMLPTILHNGAYLLTLIAFVFFFIQLFKMFHSRAKIKHDIWALSIYVAYGSFVLSVIFFVTYLLNSDNLFLRTALWLLFVGFFGFIIIGNFYKIIPFLVWFHIYSPLIETQSVPMLHQLLDNKRAHLQWFYSVCGLILSSVAIMIENTHLFYGAMILLIFGGFILVSTINHIFHTNT